MNLSPFACKLGGIILSSDVFTEEDWRLYFGVKEETLADWLLDGSIPSPSNLNMMVTFMERFSTANKQRLAEWYEMEKKRATSVSPHGARMLPTVYEYRKRLRFSELSNRLAKLDPKAQGELLLELYPEDKIFEYTRLFHKYADPQAQKLVEFREKYSGDLVLMERIAKIDAMFPACIPEVPK